MRSSDVPSRVPCASLPSRRGDRPALRSSLPSARSAARSDRGLGHGVPLCPVHQDGRDGTSQVPGGPPVHMPRSLTPAGLSVPRFPAPRARPSAFTTASAPAIRSISRLHHAAYAHPAYASRLKVTPRPCNARFRLVASLYRAGSSSCWVPTKGLGFYIAASFPRLSWRTIDQRKPDGARRGQRPRVIAVPEDGSAPPERVVHRTREADHEAAQAVPQRTGVVGLDDEMEMVILRAEMDHAEAAMGGSAKRAADGREDTRGSQTAHDWTAAKRDVHRARSNVRRPRAVRNAGSAARRRLPSGPAATAAPGTRRR